MLVVSRDRGLAAVGRRGGNVSLKEASTAGEGIVGREAKILRSPKGVEPTNWVES